MNRTSFFKTAIIAIPLVLASCGSSKKVAETTVPDLSADSIAEKVEVIQKISENNQQTRFITSKIKFDVEVGEQRLSLTGNLWMKRDDVIRLQLMAFGFVEAGRLEFTEDYVLIMDRINKQFLKVAYDQVSFLRNSGINFYTLQGLFWNELFQPGKDSFDITQSGDFDTEEEGSDLIISLVNGSLSYRWLTDKESGRIQMANILFHDKYRDDAQLNWQYGDFDTFGKGEFPKSHTITFTLPSKEVKLGMLLNYVKDDDTDWDTRTEVSSKYEEVDIDEILRRFMAL